MRDKFDTRKDYQVKKDFLEEIIKKYYVTSVFDDRDQVVEMRRDAGLQCYQVDY
jgi:hypothetical protein